VLLNVVELGAVLIEVTTSCMLHVCVRYTYCEAALCSTNPQNKTSNKARKHKQGRREKELREKGDGGRECPTCMCGKQGNGHAC